MGCEYVNWICWAQDMDRRPAFVNMVMDLVSYVKCKEFLD